MCSALKLAIDIGHNVRYDKGAIGIVREDDLNYNVGVELIGLCKELGIQVIDCTPKNANSLYDSLFQRVNIANSNKADFFISIHHNKATGGEGTEILCLKGGRAENIANSILNETTKLGLKNRGVKNRGNLYVINRTVMPAIIIECAFCDSTKDMKNYNEKNMAKAIFKGIKNYFNKSDLIVPKYYTVVKGDTLWSIAKKHGVTLNEILSLNTIENPSLIFEGQKIKIK